jgi:glutamyl/glutaminyl-tRNA synthetase
MSEGIESSRRIPLATPRRTPSKATKMLPLPSDKPTNAPGIAPNAFTAADVETILREHGWLAAESSTEQSAWCERAAALLGSHAADRTALSELLGLVFHYEAQEILARIETHALLSRKAARDVLRQLALLLLDSAPLNSERFSEIITAMKIELDLRGRDLFHPIRLALAGRSGEGDLDRVILLLDDAAILPFAAPVKNARTRILEFCTALD